MKLFLFFAAGICVLLLSSCAAMSPTYSTSGAQCLHRVAMQAQRLATKEVDCVRKYLSFLDKVSPKNYDDYLECREDLQIVAKQYLIVRTECGNVQLPPITNTHPIPEQRRLKL